MSAPASRHGTRGGWMASPSLAQRPLRRPRQGPARRKQVSRPRQAEYGVRRRGWPRWGCHRCCRSCWTASAPLNSKYRDSWRANCGKVQTSADGADDVDKPWMHGTLPADHHKFPWVPETSFSRLRLPERPFQLEPRAPTVDLFDPPVKTPVTKERRAKRTEVVVVAMHRPCAPRESGRDDVVASALELPERATQARSSDPRCRTARHRHAFPIHSGLRPRSDRRGDTSLRTRVHNPLAGPVRCSRLGASTRTDR
jgi:hypothetical protein